jgi:hypothetical protein
MNKIIPDTTKAGSKPEDFRFKKELPSDGTGLAKREVPKTRQDLGKDFLIELPPAGDERVGASGLEGENQVRMFELRKLFLANKQTEQFVWIPQALESMVRSGQSSFPGFDRAGVIRGISVDSESQIVRLLVEKEDGQPDAFEIEMEQLETYSAELVVNGLEDEVGKNEIVYSSEMNEAIEGLSDEGRYRWDMIARVGTAKALNPELCKDKHVDIRAVAADATLGAISGPGGVGVFKDGEDAKNKWSVTKVTGDDVPMTEYEKKIMGSVRGVVKPEEEGNIKEVLDLVHTLQKMLNEQLGIKKPGTDQSGGWTERLRHEFSKRVRPEGSHGVSAELEALLGELHRSSDIEIQDDVVKHVYAEKGTHSDENPFECTGLPEELAKRVREKMDQKLDVIKKIIDILKTNEERFRGVLEVGFPDSVIPSTNGLRAKRADRARETFGNLERVLPKGGVADLKKQLTEGVNLGSEK